MSDERVSGHEAVEACSKRVPASVFGFMGQTSIECLIGDS